MNRDTQGSVKMRHTHTLKTHEYRDTQFEDNNRRGSGGVCTQKFRQESIVHGR